MLILLIALSVTANASQIKEISGGTAHVCTLSTQGDVDCWGHLSQLQVAPPKDLGKALSVQTNYFTTCAVLLDRSLRCWGLLNKIPTNLGPVKEVAVGERHVCVIKQEDSKVKCWGDLKEPQDLGAVKFLTSGRDTSCAIKVNDTPLCWGDRKNDFDGLKVKFIAAPHYGATCAILMDNTVKCWLGSPSWNEFASPKDLGPVKDLGSGEIHNCALTQSNKVRCWGYDSAGQTVVVPEQTKDIISISKTNGSFTCAMKKDNTYTCWGGGFPHPPENLGQALQISGQDSSYCAISLEGRVHCWGIAKLKETSHLPSMKKISVAKDVACGIDHNDEVHCWGDNSVKQLQVPAQLGKVSEVSVSGGGSSPCAVTKAGIVKCWGSWHQDTYPISTENYSYMSPGFANTGCATTIDGKISCLGNSFISGKPIEFDVPKDLLPIHKFLMDDWTYGCAMTSSNSLVCFGDKNSGEILPPPSDIGKIKKFSIGRNTTCVITPSDDLRCWTHRQNDFGEALPIKSKVLDVAAGFRSGCAILQDQSVQCWSYLLRPQD